MCIYIYIYIYIYMCVRIYISTWTRRAPRVSRTNPPGRASTRARSSGRDGLCNRVNVSACQIRPFIVRYVDLSSDPSIYCQICPFIVAMLADMCLPHESPIFASVDTHKSTPMQTVNFQRNKPLQGYLAHKKLPPPRTLQ